MMNYEFDNNNLKYYSIKNSIISENDYVGTGTIIKLWDGDMLLDSKEIIIVGDITGDGTINNKDVTMLNRYILELEDILYVQRLAADVNGDGYVNNKDISMLSRYLVGKESI